MSWERAASRRHRHVHARFAARKAVGVVCTLVMVTLLSFLLMRLSPVDPAEAYVKRHTAIVTDEQIEQARIDLGLDQPLPLQYVDWAASALTGDLGISLESGLPVMQEMAEAVPVTLAVVGVSTVFMVAGVIVVGCLGWRWRSRVGGTMLTMLCALGVSVPAFFLAIVFLDVFAVKLGVVSVVSETGIMRFVPAALCLSVAGVSFYGQLLADALVREMDEDWALYARCRGLTDARILLTGALPHALVGLLPSFAQMVGLCLANAAIVERVFSLPGLGYAIIDAVMARDAPMIHATVLFLAVALVLLGLVAELGQHALARRSVQKGTRAWA